MPPSAITGMSPAPSHRVEHGGELRHADAGDDARRADASPGRRRPSPHPRRARTSARAPSRVATLPATSCTSGNASRTSSTVASSTPSAVAVRRVDDQHVHPGVDQRLARAPAIVAAAPMRRRDAQPAVLVLVRVGVLPPLVDVLHRDQAPQPPSSSTTGSFSMRCFAEDPLGFVERRCPSAR